MNNTYANFKEQVLNYENDVFNNYTIKRKQLIENITNLQLTDLNKEQMNNFINDLKMILDPIKNTTENIDHYLSNKCFTNNYSTETLSEMQFMIIFHHFFLPNLLRGTITSCSDSSDSGEESESVSE